MGRDDNGGVGSPCQLRCVNGLERGRCRMMDVRGKKWGWGGTKSRDDKLGI